MSNQDKADLSVIIASYNSENTIEDCISSIERQKTSKKIEIILVDSSTDNTVDLVQNNFPAVKVHHFNQRKYCGDARNFGISIAGADIIAFMDSDCTVDDDWGGEVLAAHEADYLIIGGIIENRDPKSLLGWAYYFCEFNLWLPARNKREVSEIAGCVLSMKRRAFELYGPFLEGTYCSDTALCWKLSSGKHKALFTPSIKVYHSAAYNLRSFLSHIYYHRRDFSRVMLKENKISGLQRTALAFLTPLLPPAMFFIIFFRVLRSGSFIPEFIRSSPMVFLGLIARAFGEFKGLLGTRKRF